MNDYRVEFVLVLTILTEIAQQLNSTPNCLFVPGNTANRWKILPLAISSKTRKVQGNKGPLFGPKQLREVVLTMKQYARRLTQQSTPRHNAKTNKELTFLYFLLVQTASHDCVPATKQNETIHSIRFYQAVTTRYAMPNVCLIYTSPSPRD